MLIFGKINSKANKILQSKYKNEGNDVMIQKLNSENHLFLSIPIIHRDK